MTFGRFRQQVQHLAHSIYQQSIGLQGRTFLNHVNVTVSPNLSWFHPIVQALLLPIEIAKFPTNHNN
ncbi:MAG: hypothetical protein ACI9UH_000016 [Gammaproteobacteria bacterium]|jgi:hypothetical protein